MGLLILALAAKSATPPPIIADRLQEGDSSIRVTSIGANASVELWINSAKSVGLTPVTGEVTFTLSQRLASGDSVQIKETIDGVLLESPVVIVQRLPNAAPLTLDAIKEGSTVVTGRSPVVSGSVSITVNGVQAGTAPVMRDGAFSVTANQDLKAGNYVVATQSLDGQPLTARTTVQKAVPNQAAGGDPPELRYYKPSGENEAAIKGLQEKMRRYGRGADEFAPQPGTRGSQPRCMDDGFQQTTKDLRERLETRLKNLEAALDTALGAREQYVSRRDGGGVDDGRRVNYERRVRSIRAAIDQTDKEISRIPDAICPLKTTPFNLVTIYEETEKERIQQYNPVMPDRRLTTFSIDKASKVRIEINADVLTPDAVFGQLKISATLTNSDGKTAKVEVANYSQVNVDPKSQKSQQAVNLQAASDIKSAFFDLYSVMLTLVTADYKGKDPRDWVNGDLDTTWWGPAPDVDTMSPAEIEGIDNCYKQYKNEIESINDVLTSNPALLKMVASSIFGMPQTTLESFLKDYKANLETMLNAEYQADARAKARRAVVQSTVDIWSALERTQDYIDARKTIAPNEPDSEAENGVFEVMYQQVIDELRRQIQPGEIDLPSYQPHDGATLSLQVEMAGGNIENPNQANGAQGSSSMALFTLRIKDYRVRPELVDATFYVRRLRDVRAANGALARVNFAPAPGATLDVTFHSRGPSGLLRQCMDRTGVLAPLSGKSCPAKYSEVLVTQPDEGKPVFQRDGPGAGRQRELAQLHKPGVAFGERRLYYPGCGAGRPGRGGHRGIAIRRRIAVHLRVGSEHRGAALLLGRRFQLRQGRTGRGSKTFQWGILRQLTPRCEPRVRMLRRGQPNPAPNRL
jgi:hypothetical protein